MSKPLFANEKVMKRYLTALLTEDNGINKTIQQPVEKLLEQVTEPVIEIKAKKFTKSAEKERAQQQFIKKEPTLSVAENEKNQPIPVVKKLAEFREGEFQALFFQVAGLTLAVPLKSLGGIYKLGEINKVFAKPKWFKGVMINRGEKLNVVDTAQWVMPEKYDEELELSLNYQYLIMIGETAWGLQAESLVNNVTLKNDDVKWRENTGKRPWLAGLIKEKMCALVDVDALTDLLEQGLDSRDFEIEE